MGQPTLTSPATPSGLAEDREVPTPDTSRVPDRVHFTWFTRALGLLLGGYLFFDKSFAYVHLPGTPVFVGEVVLAIGLVEAVGVRSPWRRLLRTSPALRMVLVFMAVCSVRLAFDLGPHGLDAVRDSATWYYGAFAFLAAAAALREPTFVLRLLRWYRQVLPWFLVWAPIAVVLAHVTALSAVTVPGTTTPINTFKANDYALHLAFALGFMWLGLDRLTGRRIRRAPATILSVTGTLGLLLAATQTRGGFVAACALLLVVFVFLPAARRRRTLFSVTGGLLVVTSVVLLLDLRIPGEHRDVSAKQVAQNLASIVGQENNNEELSGTVEWRRGFWDQVLADLRTNKRIGLTGLGFGVILPDRYDIDAGVANPANPLRSAHNTHLTMLARIGFPGFCLWLALWIVWCHQILRWVLGRGRGTRDPDVAYVVWLLAAVPGFLVNAFFDPTLEGPHAAAWLWVIVGLGIAHTLKRPPAQRSASLDPGRSATP